MFHTLKFNKCPHDFDIELWQLICNNLNFKDQNYLLSCCKNFLHQLKIFRLENNYGQYMINYILALDKRYHNLTYADLGLMDMCFNQNYCSYHIIKISMKYLSKCKYINLRYRIGVLGSDFQYLTNIRSIDLSHCKQIANDDLKYLTNVKWINLTNCNITDFGLQYLDNASTIIMDQCDGITGIGFKNICNVKNLSVSACSNLNISNLSFLNNVKNIDISCNGKITDIVLSYLKNAKNIDLTLCTIRGTGLKYLSNANTVVLNYCDFSINCALQQLTNVKNLYTTKSNQHCIKLINDESKLDKKNQNILIRRDSYNCRPVLNYINKYK